MTDTRDDLRPYTDDEIPAAMTRMAADPTLDAMAGFAFPGADMNALRARLREVRTAAEFQAVFVRPLLENIIRHTSDGLTVGGAPIDYSAGHVYMSDHRDIVLDGAMFQLVLLRDGRSTSEITFGSNLISSPFVEDFGRSNKMYKILRGGGIRELVHNSQVLSEHIHAVVSEGRGIWISQRDGRTKDGDDRTDQGLVKMLTLGSGLTAGEALARLNIVPFAVSYEYESCDALKAREIYRRRRGGYEKAPGEDLQSIITGVKQPKGRIHIEVCRGIESAEIEACDTGCPNELMRGVAGLIDRRIWSSYRLFPTNFMAYDLREGGGRYSGTEYDAEAMESFAGYIEGKLDGIEGDRAELREILLDIYANPVRNKLSLQ